MRCLVRFCGVDSMTGGFDSTSPSPSWMETGKNRTEEEGLSRWRMGSPARLLTLSTARTHGASCSSASMRQCVSSRLVARSGGEGLQECSRTGSKGKAHPKKLGAEVLRLKTFSAIPSEAEYQQIYMLEKAGGSVILAEDSGRFSPAMDCYLSSSPRRSKTRRSCLLGMSRNMPISSLTSSSWQSW